MIPIEEYCSRLEHHAGAIASLIRGIPEEMIRWRPGPEKWSVLEIINHLADEERFDFRHRIQLTLEDPTREWPPIDPPGWVKGRRYNQRELEDSLEDFLGERKDSLAWLRQLKNPDWEKAHEHPTIGPLRAGDLMASWLAHDYLHLRQLARTQFLYFQEKNQPFQTGYAGPWPDAT